MKLLVLGSGTTCPKKDRNAPGFILKIGTDNILLDAGEGIKKRIIEAGVDIYEIDHIFISHFHIDHVNEIPAILWDFAGRRQKDRALYLYGPKGFKKFFQEWMTVIFPGFFEREYFKTIIKECTKTSFSIKDVKIKTQPGQKHALVKYKDGVFFRFEHQNKSFVYAGDVFYDYPKKLIKIAQNADLLLIESAVLKKKIDHLTPERAGQIAQEAKVKRLALNHFYFPVNQKKIKKMVRKHYKGPIIIAKDLMEIKI